MSSIVALESQMEDWKDENNRWVRGVFIRDPADPHRHVKMQRWSGNTWFAQQQRPELQLRVGQARDTLDLLVEDEVTKSRPKALR
eukprot:3090093-Amphidinium_carterae.1